VLSIIGEPISTTTGVQSIPQSPMRLVRIALHSEIAPLNAISHTLFGLSQGTTSTFDVQVRMENPYKDTTRFMGYSTNADSFPTSCFNANTKYLLGWYSDRIISLDMRNSWSSPIFAFVDYDKTSTGHAVIVSVGDHIFLQYNRAREFNYQTRQRRDEVVIVFNANRNSLSNLLGGVALGTVSTVCKLHSATARLLRQPMHRRRILHVHQFQLSPMTQLRSAKIQRQKPSTLSTLNKGNHRGLNTCWWLAGSPGWKRRLCTDQALSVLGDLWRLHRFV
jgi:hypothetical protein